MLKPTMGGGGMRDEKKKVKMEDSESPWPDLPLDIFNSIYQRVSYVDQTSMGGVCKKWRSLLADLIINLPLLLTISPDHSLRLTDYLNHSKTLHPLHPLLNSHRLDLFSSISGWLLLYSNARGRRCFFFYNPFSSLLTRLPRMPRAKVTPATHRATFSTSPASRDCMVFVVEWCKDNKIVISTCCQAQDSWRWTAYHRTLVTSNAHTHTHIDVDVDVDVDIDIDIDIDGVKDVVLSSDKSKLYCVFNCGLLGMFDALSHEWKEVIQSVPPGTLRDGVRYEFHLVVRGNGDVLLVCHGAGFILLKMTDDGNDDTRSPSWVKEHGLGEEAVFLGSGHYPSYCVPVAGQVSAYSNRIFYRGHMSCWYYSLATGHSELLGFPDFSHKSAWIDFSTFYRIPA